MKKLFAACVLSFFAVSAWCEPAAKAVYDANTTTLTFYYDENTYSGEGITQYGMNSGSNEPAWTNCSATVTKAVITDAFRYYQPASVYRWFYNMKQLTSIDGLTNLDTSDLTSLRRMFQGSNKLTELDLSSFDTAKVADTREMFSGCTVLTTILVSDLWTNAGMNNGKDMFKSCGKLVGGAGTTLNTEQVGPAYAHVDGGAGNPGYLTLKNPPEPPTIVSVEVSNISHEGATVTVTGSNLQGGGVTVELLYDNESVAKKEIDDFDEVEFTELTPEMEYVVKVTAMNAYGSAVDDSASFTTLAAPADSWFYDADEGSVS